MTAIECDRVLRRAVSAGPLSEKDAAERRGRLARAAQHWALLDLDDDIVERARRPFPREPVRTLDAIHLATAVVARGMVPGLGLLSLDERIRDCGRELGFDLLPA